MNINMVAFTTDYRQGDNRFTGKIVKVTVAPGIEAPLGSLTVP